jgi:hypothetical protein
MFFDAIFFIMNQNEANENFFRPALRPSLRKLPPLSSNSRPSPALSSVMDHSLLSYERSTSIMPPTRKTKKRRTLHVTDNLNLLSNLTGFDDAPGDPNSLDECLESFNTQHQSTTPDESSHQNQKKKRKDDAAIPSYGKQNLLDSSRVESWNRSFLSWIRGSPYSPGLLPNIDEEISRNFKVQELSSFLLKSCNDLRMPAFERWLVDSKMQETLDKTTKSHSDPVLPLSSSPRSQASQRLVQEISQNTKNIEEAEKTVAELCRKANSECQELLSRSDRFLRQSPLNKGDRIEIEKSESESITILYSRKKWKKPFIFKINKEHYDKLQDRFFEIHNSRTTTILDRANPRVRHSSNILVLALLLRYSALSGGQLLQDLRGGGMQGAVHNQVFEVLESAFHSPWLEGFASPFNSYLTKFCSAFPDIEWHFGSIGSFMDCNFQQGGCCEVNPPFSPGLMDHMSSHMINQLEAAGRKDVSLTFVVIVPTADNSQKSALAKQSASLSFNRMISSPYCAQHIRFPAREHGYIEGAQHMRPTRFKESAYDTSVILLQSQKDTSIDMEKLKRDLKESFASRHREEISQRKKRQQN